MRQRLFHLLITLGLSLTLWGCSKDPNLSNDPSEQSKAISVASRFLEAFATGNSELAIEMSTVPFWGDGDLISSQAELQAEILEQTKGMTPPKLIVKGAMMLSLAQLEIVSPGLHHKIQQEIIASDVYAVPILLSVDGEEEHGVVLVKRQSNGIWKVIGMGD